MRLTFSGHLNYATLDQFEHAMVVAFAAMPVHDRQCGDYLFLADLRDLGVKSCDITERLRSIIARRGSRTRKIGMLMSGTALEMMQAKRGVGQEGKGFFVSNDDAVE